MKKKYDATVANGKYQDKDGNEKTRYLTIGAVFERDDGTLCMKLESVPVKFEGWINFYTPKFKDLAENIEKQKPKPLDDLEDEIPF